MTALKPGVRAPDFSTRGGWPRIGEVDFGRDSVVSDEDSTLRWYDYLLKGERRTGWKAKSPSNSSFWERTFGGKKMLGRSSGPAIRAFIFIPRARRTRSAATGRSAPRRPPASTPISTSTILRILRPPAAGLSAATLRIWLRARLTSVRWSPAVTCWFILRRRSLATSRSPALSALNSTPGSSAVDTDFTGKLVDVWPNGFARNHGDCARCC